MKPFSPRREALTDEQASLWAARLEGGVLSSDDRTSLEAWLAEDPAHRTRLSEYCQFSADLEAQLPVLVAAGATLLPPERPAARGRPWWVAGVGLAAAAALALTVWVAWPASRPEAIATSVGQRRTITLSDGTQVELSARTSLVVEQTGKERRVRLAQGEAYFVVAKDKSRPFFVETPSGSVRVTGTTFDVLAMPDSKFGVTVVEGTVQVRPAVGGETPRADPYILHVGDRLEAGPGGVSRDTLSEGALADAVAWRNGIIVFNGVPLNEVLRQIAYYHGCSFTVSPDVATKRVGGRYSLDDLNGFCADLEQAIPVLHVTRDPNGNLQVSRRVGP